MLLRAVHFRGSAHFPNYLSRRLHSAASSRSYSDSKANLSKQQEEYNEPGGYLFGKQPGVKEKPNWEFRTYAIFYLGGLAVFMFLWQYKPDSSSETWARNEAIRRMRERGVDI